MSTHSSSLSPLFLTAKGVAEKESHQIVKTVFQIRDCGMSKQQPLSLPAVQLSSLCLCQMGSKSKGNGLGNMGKSPLTAPDTQLHG